MNTQSSLLQYRAPQGRPRAIPPCDVAATASARAETTKETPAGGRPVREPSESSGHYGARVRHWLESQDPVRKAARVAKMKATNRKLFLRRKRKEAAAQAVENGDERWYTPKEVAEITGWSPEYVRNVLAANWPSRPSQRAKRASNRETQIFGNPYMMSGKPRPPVLRAKVVAPEAAPPTIVAPAPPKPSLWQRIKGWFA